MLCLCTIPLITIIKAWCHHWIRAGTLGNSTQILNRALSKQIKAENH